MAQKLKLPLIGTLALLLIAVACLFAALPWLVSSDLMRGAVQRDLSSFVGRPVILDGSLELDLFPSPKARITNVRVPARGNEGENTLTINRIEADISLLTILSRNPHFTAYKLDGPQLTLQRRANGTFNWPDVLGKISAATQQAKAALSASRETQTDLAENTESQDVDLLPEYFPTRMGTVSFSSGTIVIEDEMTIEPIKLTALNGSINWSDLDGAASTKISGVYNGQPVNLEGQVQKPLALLAGDKSTIRVLGSSDLGKFNFEGTIGFLKTFFADGKIQVSAPALSPLMEWLNGGFNPSGNIAELSFVGGMHVTNRKARFDALDIQLDKNLGKGLLEISFPKNEKPLISGTFDFSALNLTDLIDVFIEVPDAGLSSLQESEFKLLDQIRTDIRISAAAANFGSISLTKLAATAQVSDETAIFDIGDVQLFGGNLQSQLQISRKKPSGGTVQINMNGTQIDTAKAAEIIDVPSIIPLGKADFTFSSQSNIASWRHMAQTAEGKIAFKMANGIARSFAASTLLKSENTGQFFTLSNDENRQEAFEKLAFYGQLSDGVVTIRDTIATYSTGTVHFEGVAPYRSSGIALTAIATPTQPDTTATDTKRFFIGGSWDRAFATPLLSADTFDLPE
ncbi:AsmA family protein [Ahrensia kielensis]|uniref:AsmA family protein n=1 Tax=Ahrensia kielensis TaxID=76980 RepID=A0ABU9T1R4_9HYPH